jgi:hypothetical protein
MLRRVRILVAPLLLSAVGCLGADSGNLLVPSNPFPNGVAGQPAPPQKALPPATQEAATRVALVGQKVLAANEQLGFHPGFRTIGAPDVAILHRGTAEVIVTEGMVKKCETEGQLAAVLCAELGRMASEREAAAAVEARRPRPEPPPRLTLDRDDPDRTHLAESAPFDRPRNEASTPPPPPPDPVAVASNLMMKAGYGAADMQAADPLLAEAARDTVWHRQFHGPATAGWTQPVR